MLLQYHLYSFHISHKQFQETHQNKLHNCTCTSTTRLKISQKMFKFYTRFKHPENTKGLLQDSIHQSSRLGHLALMALGTHGTCAPQAAVWGNAGATSYENRQRKQNGGFAVEVRMRTGIVEMAAVIVLNGRSLTGECSFQRSRTVKMCTHWKLMENTTSSAYLRGYLSTCHPPCPKMAANSADTVRRVLY